MFLFEGKKGAACPFDSAARHATRRLRRRATSAHAPLLSRGFFCGAQKRGIPPTNSVPPESSPGIDRAFSLVFSRVCEKFPRFPRFPRGHLGASSLARIYTSGNVKLYFTYILCRQSRTQKPPGESGGIGGIGGMSKKANIFNDLRALGGRGKTRGARTQAGDAPLLCRRA